MQIEPVIELIYEINCPSLGKTGATLLAALMQSGRNPRLA